jgi:hypothetical protein
MKNINVVSALCISISCISIAPWLAAQQPPTPVQDNQPTAQQAGQTAESETPVPPQQTPTPAEATPPQPTSVQTAPAETAQPTKTSLLLKRDTEVRLELAQELSSTKSKKGDEVRFTIVDDVVAEGRVVVPRGTVLKSKVTHATPAHVNDNCTALSSGVIEFSTPKLVFADGSRATLDGRTAKERKEDVDRLTPGEVAIAVIASPIWVPLVALEFAVGGTVLAVDFISHPQDFANQKAVPPDGCHDKLEDKTLGQGKVYTYYVVRDINLPASAFAVASLQQ